MVSNEVVAAAQKVAAALSCFLCFVAIFVVYDLYKKRHILKFARSVKGYPFYPVIGNSHYTIWRDLLTVVENVKKKYGLPCGIWNGHDYHYITVDASEIKVILNHSSTFNKGSLYETVQVAFEGTLLLADFESWKRNRKIYSRSFSQPILNSFVDVFYNMSCTLVDILKQSESRDVYDICCRLSLDNFCANIMTLDMNIQKDMNNQLICLIERAQNVAGKQIFLSHFIPNCILFLFFKAKYALRDFFEMKKIISNILNQKRHNFKNENDFRENSNKLPLMDMMLEAEGRTFTDEHISREIILFSLAATDTSGITLAFTFTLLGMNPEAQEKVYQEVKQTVGLEGPISHNDLPNLKYTERAIFEVMRLLPVTPTLERYAEADVDLGDKIIPAGVNVMISILYLHRSEAYWKNPLEFNPDRFLTEEVEKRHPYAFIPFSGGPRNCIGFRGCCHWLNNFRAACHSEVTVPELLPSMKYALMMMKTTVASVIRKFEVRSKHKSVLEMEFESFITMKTVHNLDCTFIPRDHQNDISY